MYMIHVMSNSADFSTNETRKLTTHSFVDQFFTTSFQLNSNFWAMCDKFLGDKLKFLGDRFLGDKFLGDKFLGNN